MKSLIIGIIAFISGIFCFIMEKIAISKKRLRDDELSNDNNCWRVAGGVCFFVVLLMSFIFVAQMLM